MSTMRTLTAASLALTALIGCAHAPVPDAGAAPIGGRQVLNPPGLAPLVPAYSVAIRSGDLVFVSGMTGVRPGTQEIIDGGVAAQTRQTLENIRTSRRSAARRWPTWMNARSS